MPKDTESLGNNKAPACESRGFVYKNKKACILTHLQKIKKVAFQRPFPVVYCYNYSALASSIVGTVSATASVVALFLERRVRVAFLATFSLAMFSL